MELFKYQQEGRDFLSVRPTAGLFDGMRLGKTRQFLTAAKKLGASTVFVVAKATGVYEWETQGLEAGFNPVILKGSSKPLPNRLNIFSYNAMCDKLHSKLVKMGCDVLGGDESDQMKNFKAQRTKAFYGSSMNRKGGVSENAKYVWIMTGTPVLNNPAELWPAIHALWPDACAMGNGYPLNYWQFVNRYCQTIDNGFGIQIVGGKNLSDLRDRLRGRTLRRTKEQVWEDWKTTLVDVLPVEGILQGIPGDEIAAVERALKDTDIVSALSAVSAQTPTLRRLTGMAKVNGVIKWVDENIEGSGKIIIFAHHREVMETVQLKLKHKSVVITGGMSSEQKKNAYTAFQNDDSIKVFLGQNQAARDSIPLWKSSLTISIEPDWVPGNNDQMMDRMAYFDKREPCMGYFAMLRGSIDENIQKALLRKKDITNQLGL